LVFGPIGTSAERLVNLIEELDQNHRAIVVVGHSMGDLVAEYAAAAVMPKDALVTIGRLHQGHLLSRFGPLVVIREMGRTATI
jgi:pimeloyl-ACP methyl ester carboxylesterase